ncbi:MAG: T9SS type A sorting domain-containing protein [Bacteroidetes bacterium]|nr:MAG: T9SS type A sorting domain-containing protein [Bacteroidota bacterium]
MTKLVRYACLFLVLISSVTLEAQQEKYWEFYATPKGRSNFGVHMQSATEIILMGGNLRNDSITTISSTQDSFQNWTLHSDKIGSMLLCHAVYNKQTIAVAGRDGVFGVFDIASKQVNFKSSGLSNYHLEELSFEDEQSLWMAGNAKSGDEAVLWKSLNQGDAWQVAWDSAGAVVHALAFQKQTGLLAGSQGLLMRSSDQGLTWNTLSLPGFAAQRQWNDIYFVTDQLVVMVGGNPAQDSVMSIARSTDGGQNWTVVLDSIAPMLNAVHFVSSDMGYAAGNDGALFYTVDGGLSWIQIQLPLTVNDDRNLQDIHFYGSKFGVVSGERGKALFYRNFDLVGPDLQLNRAEKRVNGDVFLYGKVNPNNSATSLNLLYSSDGINFTSSAIGNYSGDSLIDFVIPFQQNAGQYWVKLSATNSAGTSETNALTVYTGPNEIPNFDFELWDSIAAPKPENWGIAGRIKLEDLGGGNRAIRLQALGEEPGAIYFADPRDSVLLGGIAYKGTPTQMGVRLKYETATGDSVMVVGEFKDAAGQSLNSWVYKLAGTQSSFTDMLFDTKLPNGAQVDTFKLLLVSTNYLGGTIDSGSVLTVDSVWFVGSNERLPNQNLDAWKPDTDFKLIGWTSNDTRNQPRPFTANPYSGRYALDLKSIKDLEFGYPHLHCGNVPDGRYAPGFSISQAYTKLYGYYQFTSAQANDSFYVNLAFFKQGQQIAWGQFVETNSTNDYNLFEIEINYQQNPQMPDSAWLETGIRNGIDTKGSGSAAKLDLLSFDMPYVSPLVAKNQEELKQILLYPNPAGKTVRIFGVASDATVFVYSSDGKQVFAGTAQRLEETDLQVWKSGVYWVRIQEEGIVHIKKLMIKPE